MASQSFQACLIAPPADVTEVENDIPPQGFALIDLAPGQLAIVERISLPSADAHFLMRIGFFPGAEVRFCRRAPLGDPSIYSVDGTHIALRAETARHILIQAAEAESAETSPAKDETPGDRS
ncbi:MAG TPA: FeoA family protein [Terriglobales bacterium]|nr:FeoA family protein [Terriglobales bacterium]